jgi:hypothetical protein
MQEIGIKDHKKSKKKKDETIDKVVAGKHFKGKPVKLTQEQFEAMRKEERDNN